MSNTLGQLTGGLIAAVNVVPFAFTIVTYVLTALALYTMAKRRAIAHPWLSWIPVADLWILGSLADQYRYVARGQRKSKRKILLGLSIAAIAVNVTVFAMTASSVVTLTRDCIYGVLTEEEIITAVLSMVMRSLGILLLMLPINILKAVFRYMALYDVYMSCEPENAVMYLIVGIFVGLTEPFFLFIVRERDKGMPPRKQAGQIHGAGCSCGCNQTAQAPRQPAPQAPQQTYPVPWQEKKPAASRQTWTAPQQTAVPQQPQAPANAAPAAPVTPEAAPAEPEAPAAQPVPAAPEAAPAEAEPAREPAQPEPPAEPEDPAL